MQISLTTYQIIFGSLINASAVILSAFLATLVSPWLQAKRDNKRWEREKLYDLHTNAYEAMTKLIQSVVSPGPLGGRNVSTEFYAATGALGRLRLAYSKEVAEEIKSMEEQLKTLYQGSLIQQREINKLEQIRQQLLAISQNDERLKDLFKT